MEGMEGAQAYPVQFSVDYPDRALSRLSTASTGRGCTRDAEHAAAAAAVRSCRWSVPGSNR